MDAACSENTGYKENQALSHPRSPPFPVSPSGGKAGAGGFPPRRQHAARQQKALARIDATGSPHKRGCRPLVYPPLGRPGQGSATKYRDSASRRTASRPKQGRIVYTKYLTLPSRFPSLTPEELRKAHGYAYGGCVIQDLGYYPFSNSFFSNLTHYVRSGDFVRSLFRNAHTADEIAFAIGALAHYIGDSVGHSVATNPSVAVAF